MGKRGPAKAPKKILEARGSWLADKREEVVLPAGTPTRPEFLTGIAATLWDSLAPLLASAGILRVSDAAALARYCQISQRWREAEEFITKAGSVYTLRDEGGKIIEVKEYPQVKIAGRCAEQLCRLEDRFGLNPSARQNFTDIKNKNKTDKDEFFL